MGGADRTAKRRKQEAAIARAQAEAAKPKAVGASGATRKQGTLQQDSDPRKKIFVIAAGLAVLALVVVLVVMLVQRGSTPEAAPVAPTYTTTSEGGVVTAGSGPVQLDVYTDYLCPYCEQFERDHGPDLVTALNESRLTVRYHQISILDARTDPAGYSTRSANAALCAADSGIWPTYSQRLWAEQPGENGAGLTDEQLIGFGTDLGAGPEFSTCVTGGTHAADVAAATDAALADPIAAPGGRFGTPTVVANGAVVNTSDSNWLTSLLAG